MFRVGDLVRLSADGKESYMDSRYNPHDQVGIVEEYVGIVEEYNARGFVSKKRMPYDVRWLSGGTNIYREVDLELVGPPISLEQMLKECLE